MTKPMINGREVDEDDFRYSSEDGEYVDSSGNIYHRKDRVWHHDTLPAFSHVNGQREWWKEGLRHRDPKHGPAILYPNGNGDYWVNGKRLSDGKQWLLNRRWARWIYFLFNKP